MSVDNLGANLARIRKSRGIAKQGEMAEKVGLSRQAYSSFERGQSVPSSVNLMKMARVLEVRMEDLLADPPSFRSIRFRSNRTLRSEERNRIEELKYRVHRWISDYRELEELTGDRSAGLFHLPPSGHDPVTAAYAARGKLGLQADEPVDDVMGLLTKAGIKFFTDDFNVKSFNGFSLGDADGGPAIIVNVAHEIPVERRIFTVAHEFGHILLHGDTYGRNGEDEYDKETYDREEKQADSFAGRFLLPEEGFEREWTATRGHDFVDRVLQIKRKYRISYMVVLFRISERAGIDFHELDLRFGREMKKTYNIDIERKKEPIALDEIDFLEDRFPALVRKAWEMEEITGSRSAEMLRISVSEMRRLILNWDSMPDAAGG